MSVVSTADVVVVGSGPARAIPAYPLAAAGAKVVILERGPWLATDEFTHDLRIDTYTKIVDYITADGVSDLTAWLAERLPEGPWLYPEDEVSDLPLRLLAAEITREKIFERLHQELPYRATVETDQWKEQPDGSVRIEQTIFVERDS